MQRTYAAGTPSPTGHWPAITGLAFIAKDYYAKGNIKTVLQVGLRQTHTLTASVVSKYPGTVNHWRVVMDARSESDWVSATSLESSQTAKQRSVTAWIKGLVCIVMVAFFAYGIMIGEVALLNSGASLELVPQ